MDVDLQALQEVRDLVDKAAESQMRFAASTQEEVDAICAAMVRAGMRASRQLAELAVEETGMGKVEDKMLKHELSTQILWDAYRDMRTVGIIEHDRRSKVSVLAEPMGVIAAIIPTTNPTSTAMYKAIISVKARNAMVASPHPHAGKCTYEAIKVMADAAVAAGAPEGLIACLSLPSIGAANALMNHPKVNIILSTGGTGIVRAAHSTGKPAIGVGPGNVPAFIERSADVRQAVKDIIRGKCFDWGVVCSSEQAMIVDRGVEKKVRDYLRDEKVYWVEGDERKALENFMVYPDGSLNTKVVGKSPQKIGELAGFSVPERIQVLLVAQDGVGKEYPLSREKLSPVLAYYTVAGAEEGIALAASIVDYGGVGHTAVIHSRDENIVQRYSERVRAFRILVNTPAPHGSVGYTTGLDPAMTLGSGTWGGSITGDNITPLHLINRKRVSWAIRSADEGNSGEFRSKKGNYSKFDEAAPKRFQDGAADQSSSKTLTVEQADEVAREFARNLEKS